MLILLLAFVQWLCFVACQPVLTAQPYTAGNLSHEIVTFDIKAVVEAAVPLSRKLLGLSIEFVLLSRFIISRMTNDGSSDSAISPLILVMLTSLTPSPSSFCKTSKIVQEILQEYALEATHKTEPGIVTTAPPP